MIGIIVQLGISWLLVWFFEKGNLGFLGFYPTKKRLSDFLLFLFITALCCGLGAVLKTLIAKQQWELNPQANFLLIVKGIWWNIKAVLFEELIFRGVLFYILIKKIGTTGAILISSIAFGIYHWFSQNLFGNPVQMAIMFITTFIMGLVLAYSYAKTFSLYISCAIHLGWNITQITMLSQGPIGNQLFIKVMPPPVVTVSYFSYYTMVFLPMVCLYGINFWLIKNKKQQVNTALGK